MKLTFTIRKEIMKPLNNKNYQDPNNFYVDPDYDFSLSRSQNAAAVRVIYTRPTLHSHRASNLAKVPN